VFDFYTQAAHEGCFCLIFLKPVLKPGDRYIMDIKIQIKGCFMKNKIILAIFSTQKVNRQSIQLIFMLIALAMLVLGVGAPNDGGGPN
jgi:hypothetical protein